MTQFRTSVYPQAGHYRPSTFGYFDFSYPQIAGSRTEVHTYFQTNDSPELVSTYLTTEGWRSKDYSFVDALLPLISGFYPLNDAPSLHIGPFHLSLDTVVILSYDEQNKVTVIEQMTFIDFYYLASD